MGQATVDLPNPQPPAPPGSADELLSQLAGEEIDRMLSDADAKPLQPGGPELSADVVASTVSPPDPVELADLSRPAAAATAARDAAPPIEQPISTGLPSDAEVTVDPAELDKLLSTGNTETDPAPIPPPAEQATSPAELAALSAPPDPAAALQHVINDAKTRQTPLLIRFLELLNAPLDACPDHIRDLAGKLAILTFMNAIGVLLYLVLFRK